MGQISHRDREGKSERGHHGQNNILEVENLSEGHSVILLVCQSIHCDGKSHGLGDILGEGTVGQ